MMEKRKDRGTRLIRRGEKRKKKRTKDEKETTLLILNLL